MTASIQWLGLIQRAVSHSGHQQSTSGQTFGHVHDARVLRDRALLEVTSGLPHRRFSALPPAKGRGPHCQSAGASRKPASRAPCTRPRVQVCRCTRVQPARHRSSSDVRARASANPGSVAHAREDPEAGGLKPLNDELAEAAQRDQIRKAKKVEHIFETFGDGLTALPPTTQGNVLLALERIGLLVTGVHWTERRQLSRHSCMRRLFAALSLSDTASGTDAASVHTAAKVVWVVAALQARPTYPSVCAAALRRLEAPDVRHLSRREVSDLLWSLATLHHDPAPPLRRAIDGWVQEHGLDGFPLPLVAQFLWGAARVLPMCGAPLSKAMPHLHATLHSWQALHPGGGGKKVQARDLVKAVWSLAVLRMLAVPAFQDLWAAICGLPNPAAPERAQATAAAAAAAGSGGSGGRQRRQGAATGAEAGLQQGGTAQPPGEATVRSCLRLRKPALTQLQQVKLALLLDHDASFRGQLASHLASSSTSRDSATRSADRHSSDASTDSSTAPRSGPRMDGSSTAPRSGPRMDGSSGPRMDGSRAVASGAPGPDGPRPSTTSSKPDTTALALLPHWLSESAANSWKRQLAGAKHESLFQYDLSLTLDELGVRYVAESSVAGYSVDVLVADLAVVIEAEGPSHLAYNTGQRNGPTQMKHRHLQALGWQVVSIRYLDWDALDNNKAAHRAYLSRRLGLKATPTARDS